MSPAHSEPRFDVLALGHAIVDVISHVDDVAVAGLGLAKGTMTVVDEARAKEIYAVMGPAVEISGGSAANTAVGVASLGGTASFAGRVADDDFGAVFRHDVDAAGVDFYAAPGPVAGATARCHILVTPDAQRTMGTHLGVAATLGAGDIDPAVPAAAAVSYLEGFLVGTPGEEAVRALAEASRRAGRRVALTLSDPSWLGLHRDAFDSLLDGADVLFANEAEALAFTGAGDVDGALALLRGRCPVVTVTLSERGALVAGPSGEPEAVPAHPVERVVDTTGAGDLYAAGFLFGLAREEPLRRCAELGALAASEVISHDGGRPAVPLRNLL
ncbi:MAG: adenosine kinase [Acidimicrobiia bacterium]